MFHKFKRARETLALALNPKKDLKNLYLWLVGGSAVVFFILCLALGNGRSTALFFKHGGDFFMDCFNQIRDCAQGSGVYSERRVIYPPMANLIFLMLSRFTSNGYNDTSFAARYSWKSYSSSMILLMMVFVLCAILTFALVFRVTRNGSVNRRLMFAASCSLSVPILYMLERGNILILCVLALLVYAFSHDSESRAVREIGLLALAFAFSLKLYPAVFGWFLIADRRYKDALRCAIYGVAMLILPSFFFGGPIFVIKTMYENITVWSSGSGNEMLRAMQALGLSELWQSVINALIAVWILVCAACFALSPFLRPNEAWKTWVLGCITILCVPSLTALYTWGFLLIPLILLSDRESFSPRRAAYLILITVPFMFLPIGFFPVQPILDWIAPGVSAGGLSLVAVWIYLPTAALSIFAVTDALLDFRKALKKRK